MCLCVHVGRTRARTERVIADQRPFTFTFTSSSSSFGQSALTTSYSVSAPYTPCVRTTSHLHQIDRSIGCIWQFASLGVCSLVICPYFSTYTSHSRTFSVGLIDAAKQPGGFCRKLFGHSLPRHLPILPIFFSSPDIAHR